MSSLNARPTQLWPTLKFQSGAPWLGEIHKMCLLWLSHGSRHTGKSMQFVVWLQCVLHVYSPLCKKKKKKNPVKVLISFPAAKERERERELLYPAGITAVLLSYLGDPKKWMISQERSELSCSGVREGSTWTARRGERHGFCFKSPHWCLSAFVQIF